MAVAYADASEALKEARRLHAEAAKFAKEGSAEEKARIPDLLKQAETIMGDAGRLKDDSKTLKQIDDLAQRLNASGGEQGEDLTTVDFNEVKGVKPTGSNFKSPEAFMKAVFNSGRRNPTINKNLKWFGDKESDSSEHKDLGESVGASGGWLVRPEDFTTIMAAAAEQTIIRRRATVIRMRGREIRIPVLDQTGTTAGVGHWFGGIRVYWTEEASSKQTTQPAWRQVSLIANKLAAYTVASDELLDDAYLSLTDFLMNPTLGFPGAMSWTEDYAFFNGSGVGQPLGILNSGARISVVRQHQDTVTYDDLAGMMQHFYGTGGIWVASQSMMSHLLTITGPSGNPQYLWGPGPIGQTLIPDMAGTLLGRPIIFTEKTPTFKSEGDLMLIDPAYYVVGDRQAVTVMSTIYDKFQEDQTSYRAVERVGGRPWLDQPWTLANGTDTVSPFVVLSAKAS